MILLFYLVLQTLLLTIKCGAYTYIIVFGDIDPTETAWAGDIESGSIETTLSSPNRLYDYIIQVCVRRKSEKIKSIKVKFSDNSAQSVGNNDDSYTEKCYEPYHPGGWNVLNNYECIVSNIVRVGGFGSNNFHGLRFGSSDGELSGLLGVSSNLDGFLVSNRQVGQYAFHEYTYKYVHCLSTITVSTKNGNIKAIKFGYYPVSILKAWKNIPTSSHQFWDFSSPGAITYSTWNKDPSNNANINVLESSSNSAYINKLCFWYGNNEHKFKRITAYWNDNTEATVKSDPGGAEYCYRVMSGKECFTGYVLDFDDYLRAIRFIQSNGVLSTLFGSTYYGKYIVKKSMKPKCLTKIEVTKGNHWITKIRMGWRSIKYIGFYHDDNTGGDTINDVVPIIDPYQYWQYILVVGCLIFAILINLMYMFYILFLNVSSRK